MAKKGAFGDTRSLGARLVGWSRSEERLGYNPAKPWGPRLADRVDDGLSVAGWTRLLRGAGFSLADVLPWDADQVIILTLSGGDWRCASTRVRHDGVHGHGDQYRVEEERHDTVERDGSAHA